MQRILRAVALIAMVASAATGAFAQGTNTGTIQVVVVDQNGGKLPGATVEASAPDTTTTRTAVTDENGVANLEALQPSESYTVKIAMSGFRDLVREKVLVRVAQTVTLNIGLNVTGVEEQVTVQAEPTPVVDVTSATTGQDITLRLTESLPTGRSYQSYLQLVPGVLPEDPTSPGNPASRSGLNYSDIRGELGISRDNVYFLDGINVTDPVNGTFGANMNTEVIQEQKVITGGIPAEFPGSPGLISQVVTKSGSNRFSGSGNYFFQNSNLVAENKNGQGEEFSTNDTAFTIGGPALLNKAWFFGSYRFFNRKDDVTLLDTNTFERSVENRQHQGFAKGTFGPTPNDSVSFSYLSDPTTISGRRDRTIPNATDRTREQGGNRFAGTYTRLAGPALFEFGAFKHNGDVSDFSAIRETGNSVLFKSTDIRTIHDEFLGGFGQDLIDQRDTLSFRGSAQINWRNHTFKGGLEWSKFENFRDTFYINGATYDSVSLLNAGVSVGDIAGLTGNTWNRLAFDVSTTNDFEGLIDAFNARPDRQRFYDAFDSNRDGAISEGELASGLRFTSTAGNPHGQINYDRTLQVTTGPQDTSSKGLSFYVEDTYRLNRLTINAGLRTEQWRHFATTGEDIFTFDWAFAPRLSATYDVLGNGRHRASAYYGRYYDPIRNNMTNFAGTLTGSVLDEQLFVLGDWVTYRTRGGPIVQDAFFAPTTKTPYTDELQFGYAIDLGNSMSVEATYYNRRTRDILEDYDLSLYALDTEGSSDHYGGNINAPNSLWLGLDYFGYTQNPGSNFVIATLAGGERNAQGLELVFRKRFQSNWQFLGSYNWLDAEGNTNSDSNADFQGDVLFLDPRAPNQFGRQPGMVAHLLKGAGSYTFDMGLQVGAVFMWNSGTHSSRTFSASNRNLPIRIGPTEVYEFGGVLGRWIAPGTVGTLENPSWGQLDLRAQYQRRLTERLSAEFFVDLFNITDNQTAIREQDLVAGQGGVAFGQGLFFNPPRRAFFGTRLKF
jgi:hypothetical protein